MNHSAELFLKAYRCALHGTRCSGAQGLGAVERREVLRLADGHRVYPMILESMYPGGAGEEEGPYVQKMIRKAERLTCGQAQMSAEFLKLYRFLGRRGLVPIVMKGIICRCLYPEPEQRSSSDEDLLVREEEFPAYHKALTEYGLLPAEPGRDIYEEHEVPYYNSRVYIELHKKPFPPESKAYGDLNRFFEDVHGRTVSQTVYGVPVRTMDHTDHLFYQLCHAYKHFLNCGIGIRLVSDIVLYSMVHEGRIDWNRVTAGCREIRAYEFASAIYRIGKVYLFPEEFPLGLAETWQTGSADEAGLLEDIVAGGVYGTSSEDRLHSSNLTLGAVENARAGSRAPVLLNALFPSFRSMRRRYPYLKRMPVLLPAAWAMRLSAYARDSVLHGCSGRHASEAVRIGNERVALMRQYRILEQGQKEKDPLKQLYKWSHTSFLAPALRPVYAGASMLEYRALELLWLLRGGRPPSEEDRELVGENVTFIAKSFERQRLAEGLCRNISRMYPGARIIIADDSREPLKVGVPNAKVIRLPFNSGLGAGLCAALEEVRTPYVMRLDDDELLTVRSLVHRELRYLMAHPELDLVGLGHTTAVRLHSPEFNFREYYRSPMADAPRPLKIPHMTRLDDTHIVLGKVANIYLARTDRIREVSYDPGIRVIDHHDFFWRAAGVLTCAVALDTVVFHRHNPYDRGYNTYRSDYEADLDHIRKRHAQMIKEIRNEKK